MSLYVGAETCLIDDWLVSVLGTPVAPVAALAAVDVSGVYDHFAKPGTPYPYVIFQRMSDIDVKGTGPDRWMINAVYIVKAVAEVDTYDPLKPIAHEIDLILQAKTVPFGGGYITGVNREGSHRFVEYEDGHQARQLGGEYRIYAQAA
jgi:hypothetical protein